MSIGDGSKMNSANGHASVPGLQRPSIASKTRFCFEGWGEIDHGSLGSFSLGKVHIDCKLRCAECHWGTLGEPVRPAGIIYVDLSFNQPEKYKLASASVRISLEDRDEHEEGHRSHRWRRRSKKGVGDVVASRLAVTDSYGPRRLAGMPSTRKDKVTVNATPELGAGGFRLGGMGVNLEKTTNRSSRWILSSYPLAGRSRHGLPGVSYNTIVWDLEENDLLAQPLHSNVFHTGLTITHEARPFYIKVEITGKLRKLTDRVRYQFPPRIRQGQGTALTLVSLGPEHQFKDSLDSVARGLAKAMERKNNSEAALEMPDSRSDSSEEPPVGQPSSSSSSSTQLSATDTLLAAPDVFSASEESEIEFESKRTCVSPETAKPQETHVSGSPPEDILKEEAMMVEERLRRLSEYPTVLMLMHLLTLLLDALNPAKSKLKKD